MRCILSALIVLPVNHYALTSIGVLLIKVFEIIEFQ
ncbi:hypothetical protein SAMN05192561_104148 [Halopenitus malekzadehii]|uniref:Uncharacterized protein n=1 Tax=Halopenitus malekzadehii TaxID=1267564 RepID=A0A1H6IS93_9EURY|nr:hypothetical protein SAMN05192561_104148 [Halopenitus malekzadehii]